MEQLAPYSGDAYKPISIDLFVTPLGALAMRGCALLPGV